MTPALVHCIFYFNDYLKEEAFETKAFDKWYSKQFYLIILASHPPKISRGGVLSFVIDINIGFIFQGADFGQNPQPEPWDCGEEFSELT